MSKVLIRLATWLIGLGYKLYYSGVQKKMFLYTANGKDLNRIGVEYGVNRILCESDDSYRERIRSKMVGVPNE